MATSLTKARRFSVGFLTIVGAILACSITTFSRNSKKDDLSSFSQSAADWRNIPSTMWSYWSNRPRSITLSSPSAFQLTRDDPVFSRDGEGKWRLVGVVSHVESLVPNPNTAGGVRVSIAWMDPQRLPIDNATWQYVETPDNLSWVAQTLVPESKRLQLAASLRQRFQQVRVELTRGFEPLLIETVRDLEPVLERRLRETLKAKQLEMRELGQKYQMQLVQQRLVPIIKKRVLPIVQSRTEPLLTEIGQEIWERASVWSFAWRYFYDALPLTERELTRKEWKRFLKQEVEPILSAHTDDFLKTLADIAQDLAEDPVIKAAVRETSGELLEDEELRRFLIETLQSVFTRSDELRDVIRRHWEGQHGQRLADNLQNMIDPWLREVGSEIFGTPDEGLTPEFVSVLRTQVLAKDRRWISVETCPVGSSEAWRGSSSPALIQSSEVMAFPNLVTQRPANF